MKKKLLSLLVVFSVFGLVACSSGPKNISKDEKKIEELNKKETEAIYIDGELFEVGSSATDFGDNNWAIQTSTSNLYSGTYIDTTMVNDKTDLTLNIRILNDTDETQSVMDSKVVSVEYTIDYDAYDEKEIKEKDLFILAGGINQTTTLKEFNSIAKSLKLEKEGKTLLSNGEFDITPVFNSSDAKKYPDAISGFLVEREDANSSEYDEYELLYSGNDPEKYKKRSQIVEGNIIGSETLTSTNAFTNTGKEVEVFIVEDGEGTKHYVGKSLFFTNFPTLAVGDKVSIYYDTDKLVTGSGGMNYLMARLITVNGKDYSEFK